MQCGDAFGHGRDGPCSPTGSPRFPSFLTAQLNCLPLQTMGATSVHT